MSYPNKGGFVGLAPQVSAVSDAPSGGKILDALAMIDSQLDRLALSVEQAEGVAMQLCGTGESSNAKPFPPIAGVPTCVVGKINDRQARLCDLVDRLHAATSRLIEL